MTKQNPFKCSAITKGIEIELTNHCSLNCKTCERKKQKDFGFMNFKTFSKTINFIKSGNYEEIFLSGLGDAFLHDKLFKMIDYLFEKLPSIKVVIPTKGQSVTPEYLKKIKILEKNRFSIIPSFSVYSLNEKNYQFLTNGNLKHFYKIIEQVKQLKLNYTLEFLITSYNINELEKFKSWAKSLNINNYGLSLTHNWNGSMAKKKHKEFFSEKVNEFLKKRRKNEICEVFHHPYVFINWKGNIYLCSIDSIKKTGFLGNVFKNSFQEIFKQKKQLNYEKTCHKCFYYQYSNL